MAEGTGGQRENNGGVNASGERDAETSDARHRCGNAVNGPTDDIIRGAVPRDRRVGELTFGH